MLDRLEAYYDAVPRTATQTETLGPFTVFIPRGAAWPYYARPRLGLPATAPITVADVEHVRERQHALGLPEAFEWVAEQTPQLQAPIAASGLTVHSHPLLVLNPDARVRQEVPEDVEVRIATAEDDLALLQAVAELGFGSPGMAIGEHGTERLKETAAGVSGARQAFIRERVRTGQTVTAAAYVAGLPVSVGSHQPVGDVTEIVGVATLPAFRRRGIGAAVVDALVDAAQRRGALTIFLSAGDDAVARVYERVGFRRLATACTAELPTP